MAGENTSGSGTQGDIPDAWMEKIQSTVATIVNQAISARDKMSDKKRGEDREAVKSDFAKMLDEKLSSLKPATGNEDPDDKSGGGKNKGASLELSTMRKQLADTIARQEAAEKRAQAEQAKNEAAELKDRVARILSDAKIEGVRARGAYALVRERIRKQSDDADAPYVFVDDANGELDLDVGLKGWTKSEEAKMYLPASGAAGSGSRPSRGALSNANGKQDTTYEDVGNFVLGLTAPMGSRLGE